MYLTRNQFDSNVTWVRIPPSAPKAAPCGALLFIFAANYARVARWDSNSPCPALCVPPGCNSPADCCKGAGESHCLRQVSLLNFTLGSDFFIAGLQNSVAFLINISPLFSSSDFRVRYKSYQQSREIAIHETAQKSVFPFCVALYFAHKNTNHLCRMGSLDFLYHIWYNSIEI